MKKDHSNPKNILIIKPSALGDIAIALPALASLRASFPDAKITWMIRPEFAQLLENVKNLDEILIFDRKLLGKWWYKPRPFMALLCFFSKLYKSRFDLVIDLQGLFRTALFGWITGAPRRFGMRSAREFATMFYTHRVDGNNDSAHVIDNYHEVVSATGAKRIVDDYDLGIDSESSSNAARLLEQHNANNRDYVVFVTGSAHESKCWPIEKFVTLADMVSSKFDVSIIAIGTKSEKSVIQKLVEGAGSPVIDLGGKTDIPVLTAMLKGAKLVISNDTGPGHIAVAVNTPTIIIFGPTNPSRIRPFKKPHSIVAIDPDTRGGAIENTDDKYRIEKVSVDSVLREVEYHLANCAKTRTNGN